MDKVEVKSASDAIADVVAGMDYCEWRHVKFAVDRMFDDQQRHLEARVRIDKPREEISKFIESELSW